MTVYDYLSLFVRICNVKWRVVLGLPLSLVLNTFLVPLNELQASRLVLVKSQTLFLQSLNGPTAETPPLMNCLTLAIHLLSNIIRISIYHIVRWETRCAAFNKERLDRLR